MRRSDAHAGEHDSHAIIDHAEPDGGKEAMALADVKSRASSATREDIVKHGMSEAYRGCKGTEGAWKRPVAHADSCRQRLMDEIVKDGDVDGRVANATQEVMESSGVAGDELKCSLLEGREQQRRGIGHR